MGEAAYFVGALMIQVKQRNKWKATGSPFKEGIDFLPPDHLYAHYVSSNNFFVAPADFNNLLRSCF